MNFIHIKKNFSAKIRTFFQITLSILPLTCFSQKERDILSSDTLKKLSMEELLEVTVTSVSKRQEKLVEVASAIQVITQEDIRRSGATSVPEALRLAHNLNVAQKNSHDWAITARGFNTDLANKLLVLIDGRTVYTPLFSGVFWDRQDLLLEDIEQIEVISGPGSTLWGSNAVNGVINIITRKTLDTKSFYGEVGGGTQLRDFIGLRYGSSIGTNMSFRVYGKYFDRDDAVFPDGRDASDSWRMGQGGFRVDSNPSERNAFTVQGDYYKSDVNLSTGGSSGIDGANILGRWTHTFSENSNLSFQFYYDRTHLAQPVPESRTDDNIIILAPAGTLVDDLDTYDLDLQQGFQLGIRHNIIAGLGYRRTYDKVEDAPGIAFSPNNLIRNLYSFFIQDEVMLARNLFFTLGTKVEHNDYTGFEYSPSVRLQLNATPTQTCWGAVSRAVRIPSRVDRHIRLPTPGFAPIVENLLIGGKDFESETVIAYEVGYRANLGKKISGSISTYCNVYDALRSTSESPPDVFGLTFPFFYENNLKGETYGVELSAAYQVFDWWKLNGGYNLLKEDIRVKPGGEDFNNALNETADPEHRFSLRSSVNFLGTLELDIGLRYVGSFEYNRSGVGETVDAYTELEIRLGWRPAKQLEFSIMGQNLLHDQHLEYVISDPNPTVKIERSVYGKLVWRL